MCSVLVLSCSFVAIWKLESDGNIPIAVPRVVRTLIPALHQKKILFCLVSADSENTELNGGSFCTASLLSLPVRKVHSEGLLSLRTALPCLAGGRIARLLKGGASDTVPVETKKKRALILCWYLYVQASFRSLIYRRS